jgi:hypothetical protein
VWTVIGHSKPVKTLNEPLQDSSKFCRTRRN